LSMLPAAGFGGPVYDPLFALWSKGKLSLRVAYRVSAQTPGDEAAWLSNAVAYMPPHFGDSMLKFLGLGEILVFKANDETRLAPGFQIPDDGRDELYKVAMLAAHRKYPLEIHAYTNVSAKQILDVFERVAEIYRSAPTPLVHCPHLHGLSGYVRTDEKAWDLLQRAFG